MEMTGDGVEIGNTSSQSQPKKKRALQLKNWFFTFNNYTESDITDLLDKFDEICTKYLFQEETGENGTKHLQGTIELKKRMRWEQFKLSKRIHWEPVRNIDASIDYCQKEHTRTGRIYQVPAPISCICGLYPWQSQLLVTLLEKPDSRTVLWCYESEGNVGKSAFVKYLVLKHRAIFCDGGEKKDIMNLIFNSNMDRCSIVCFDLCRSKMGKISYNSIEAIKNGLICNTKYETGFKVFNNVHVVIFSNSAPDYEQLSIDRWKVYEIKNSELVPTSAS